jgi:hypothetical protein
MSHLVYDSYRIANSCESSGVLTRKLAHTTWQASPAELCSDILAIKRHKSLQTRNRSKESPEYIGSRWILSSISEALCIVLSIYNTRSTSRRVQRQYVNAPTYNFDPPSSLTSPPPTRSYCLPLLQPIHLAKTSSPPTPGANPLLCHPPPSTPIPRPSHTGLVSASPSAIAFPGESFKVTIGRWSYPPSSSSSCVRTGVQQASVSSKIFSQCDRGFDLKVLVNSWRRAGQVARSSLGPSRSEALVCSPLSN